MIDIPYPAMAVEFYARISPSQDPGAVAVEFDVWIPTDLNLAPTSFDLFSVTATGMTLSACDVTSSGVVDPSLSAAGLSPSETVLGELIHVVGTYIPGSAYAEVLFPLRSESVPFGAGDPWPEPYILDRACAVFNLQINGSAPTSPIPISHLRCILSCDPL